jgi:hypothetical protein
MKRIVILETDDSLVTNFKKGVIVAVNSALKYVLINPPLLREPKTLECPLCSSPLVRSVDNQPLEHFNNQLTKTANEYPMVDNVIILKFDCDTCQEQFEKTFNLTLI